MKPQVSIARIGGWGGGQFRSSRQTQTDRANVSNINKMKSGSLARRGPSANTRRIWATPIKAKMKARALSLLGSSHPYSGWSPFQLAQQHILDRGM